MSDKDIIDMKEENGQWSAYVSEFSPEKLWEKIKGHAKKVGCEGIRSALRLFYALDNPSMPLKTKMVIYGALGYFISPIDVIPDFIPVVGFTDDIGVLAAAVVMAASYIDAKAKAKADELAGWFRKALLKKNHTPAFPELRSLRHWRGAQLPIHLPGDTIRIGPARRPQWRPSDAAGLQARCSTAA
ncbi:MAG: YkvA family protein [Bilophila wadsworthia]